MLSNFLPLSAVGFLNGLGTAVWIFTFFLIAVAMITVQEYDFFKFLLTGIAIAFFMILAVFSVKVIVPFSRERSYIKAEINRTDGAVLCYWKHELKKLYVRQIPFFGKMILKSMR